MAFADWLGDNRFVCANLLPFAASICHQAFCKFFSFFFFFSFSSFLFDIFPLSGINKSDKLLDDTSMS